MSTKVSDEKVAYEKKLNGYLDTYSKILFCDIDNVQSQQLHKVRANLRAAKNEMLVGKKTLQKRIIALRGESDSATDSDKALKQKLCDEEMLVGNLALVFTNGEVADVQKILSSYRVQAPARIGAVAPCDVTILAGNTGMEPTMTSFFQALNIPTKIAKGTVEIVSDKKVLSTGDKVDASTAQLLQKLNMSPFYYQAEIKFFFERGLIFTAEDLSISDSFIETQLFGGIANLTAASLGAGLITDLSFPHAIMDGFKDLLAASVASDYVFTEFDGKALREGIKSGKIGGGGAAPAGAPAKAAAPAPAAKDDKKGKKDEKPPSDDEGGDMGMGLFD